MPRISCTVSGALVRHGRSGITWWVWMSKMNSVPDSACSQAAVSLGDGRDEGAAG